MKKLNEKEMLEINGGWDTCYPFMGSLNCIQDIEAVKPEPICGEYICAIAD